MLTRKEALEIFRYDSDTGELYWAIKRWRANIGDRAGGYDVHGYRRVKYRQIEYPVHRIIWLMRNGKFPAEIDHINGIRNDNKLTNLREVTRKENTQNASRRIDNSSGSVGVCWDKKNDKWVAQIKANGIRKHLGYFINWWDAVCARKAAEYKYGFHVNHGRISNA